MYPIIVKKVFGKKEARVEEERKDWKDVCPSEIWHEILASNGSFEFSFRSFSSIRVAVG